MGYVMVQLVGQRRQRPATRPPKHDLPHQVTGQLLRQHGGRHSQQLSGGLPRARQAGIIKRRQHPCYPCLQSAQQRRLPGQRRIGHRLAEDLADHHRHLPGLLTAGTVQLPGSELDRSRGRLPQRTFLIAAQH